MKKLLLICATIFGFTITPLWLAAEESPNTQKPEPSTATVFLPINCTTDYNKLVSYITEKYEEKAFSEAETVAAILNPTTGGKALIAGSTVIFVNPKTGTFSVIIKWGDNNGCLLNSGKDFRPFGAAPRPEEKENKPEQKTKFENGRHTST